MLRPTRFLLALTFASLALGCASRSVPPAAAVASTDVPRDDAHAACRSIDVPARGSIDGGVCGLDGPFSERFGGRVPTLADVSPCASNNPRDVLRVRYEYPRCNLVVIEYAGWYSHTRFVFDRTCGALLASAAG